MDDRAFIRPHGHYETLLSYRKAEIAFDVTYCFCQRFMNRRDRTVDQMIQAARSGKQNIAEGSRASGTSTEMEIKLTNVARASLEELRIDYEDFLRSRSLQKWPKDSREARYIRDLGRSHEAGYEVYRTFCETRSAEVVANLALCVIHQANYLLDKQIRSLENEFVQRGGIRERMTAARKKQRMGLSK